MTVDSICITYGILCYLINTFALNSRLYIIKPYSLTILDKVVFWFLSPVTLPLGMLMKWVEWVDCEEVSDQLTVESKETPTYVEKEDIRLVEI